MKNEEEKTAIINQAVTQGINPDVKLKDSGIDWLGDIPEHWEVTADLFNIRNRCLCEDLFQSNHANER